MFKKIWFLIVILIFLITENCFATLIFLEAEEFDNLSYFGNWVDFDNWYIKFHSHASGRAFVVCHYKGKKMYKKLAFSLKPGVYNIYLRVVLTRSKDTKNIFKVSIGNFVSDVFIPETSSIFIQDFSGSGYGWYKLPDSFNLKKDCNIIAIESLEVENMGIGDDPEYEKPYIILDSLIITDEKIEVIKGYKGRNEIKFLETQDPRKTNLFIPYPTIKSDIKFENLPKERKPFISSKNLLRNSSFEISLKPHFGSKEPIISGYNLDADCLSEEKPFHGKYCVKLIPKVLNILKDYTGSKEEILYGGGFTLFAMDKFLRKEIEEVSKSSPLVISIYLRTNGKKINFNLCGKNFEASHTEWKRYFAPFSPYNLSDYIFTFSTTEPDACVFIDAIQIERGTEPTDYIPLEGLEVGFQIDKISNIFYKEEFLPLELSISQSKYGKRENISVEYEILNTFLELEYKGELSAYSQPGKVVTKKMKIPFSKLGNYLFLYKVKNHPEQDYIIPISIVENPKKIQRNRMLGAIISTNEEIMKIFYHAGFDWVNSLNDRLTYFDYIWPKKDDFRFFDKYWKMWKEKYDIEYAFWRPPFNPPSWAENIYGKEPAAHMDEPTIGYKDWEKFWETITQHANYIKIWLPTDEQSYHRGPKESIPYIDIASKIIRKNIPDAIIMNSSQTRHFIKMLELKPDLDIGNAIGGSRHNFERNNYFYDRYLKEKIKKEFWIVGVGWSIADWSQILNFETFTPDKDYWESKFCKELNSVTESIFNESAIIGVERFGLYTAKFDAGADPYSLFSSYNTIKPFGINFINIVNFLRNHRKGNVVHFEKAYGVCGAYLYKDGKIIVYIGPDGSYEKVVLNLTPFSDKVKIYDFNLNPLKFQKTVILPIGKCIFIENDKMDEKTFLSVIEKIEGYPLDFERRIILPDKDGLKLSTFKKIKDNIEEVFSIKLPEDTGIKYPIIQTRNNRNYSWAIVAKKIKGELIKIDGKMDEEEWQKIVPSFIYCWDALDGSLGALQGIENFGDIFSLKDISLNFKTLWDDNNLYIGFEILDDVKTDGDKIVIKLDADLLGDLYEPEFNSDDYTIEIPLKEGKFEISVVNNIEQVGNCNVCISSSENGYFLEMALPFSVLKLKDNRSKSIGINIEVFDRDKENTISLLSWTGNYMPRKSPFGFGQLILLK